MYCAAYRGERNLIAALLKDCLQAVGLVKVIGEQEQLVAVIEEALEILAYKVEVLVEKRLQRCVELHFCAVAACSLWAQLPMLCALCILFELVACHQLRHLGQRVVRQPCLQRETLVVELVYAPLDKGYVLGYQNCVLWQEPGDCNGLAAAQLGHDGGLVGALLRELVLDGECAYALHLVPEEVNAVGIFR